MRRSENTCDFCGEVQFASPSNIPDDWRKVLVLNDQKHRRTEREWLTCEPCLRGIEPKRRTDADKD